MARSKLFASMLLVIGVYMFAGASVAKAVTKCQFNGNYSFYFWDPDAGLSGVGYFGVKGIPATRCRSGIVLPGGIINCNFEAGEIYEDYIEDGSVNLETDGEGTMEIETNSSDGICGTGKDAIELDISVVLSGKTVLFNSNGAEKVVSGTTPNAGSNYAITGRADKCFAGSISGSYDMRFWNPDANVIGDCLITLGAGKVTGGTCQCNNDGTESLSEIESGAYTLGEDCQSSTGYLWFMASSNTICGYGDKYLALDFAVALNGSEIMGICDTAEYILGDTKEPNTGYLLPCAFEGWL